MSKLIASGKGLKMFRTNLATEKDIRACEWFFLPSEAPPDCARHTPCNSLDALAGEMLTDDAPPNPECLDCQLKAAEEIVRKGDSARAMVEARQSRGLDTPQFLYDAVRLGEELSGLLEARLLQPQAKGSA